MKFSSALILFCVLAAGLGVADLLSPASSLQLVEKIFYLGLGVFSCWFNINLPHLHFLGRLCRFFKAIPNCWAESKETFK